MNEPYYNRNDSYEVLCQRCEGRTLKDTAGAVVVCPDCKGNPLKLNKDGEKFLAFLKRCLDRIEAEKAGG